MDAKKRELITFYLPKDKDEDNEYDKIARAIYKAPYKLSEKQKAFLDKYIDFHLKRNLDE